MLVTVTTEELAKLIALHMNDANPKWLVKDSPISGRGVFAKCNLAAGELIFDEHALLAGPTAHNNSKLNTCCVCYCFLNDTSELEMLCMAGCSMPVCKSCTTSKRHQSECELFRKWKPKDLTHINKHSLRIVSVMRCYFLNVEQRRLLLGLQANPDKYYKQEVARAAACFDEFPKNPEVLEMFYRTISAYNTNAFEGRSNENGHEVLIRALFPLAGLMNHQCIPNAAHYFDEGETIKVYAAKSIAEGEEIFFTYTHLLWSNLARKLFLAVTKQFNCHCARCLDPTENGTYLSALFCRETTCKGIAIPIQTKTLQPDWKCLTCNTIFPHAKMARYQDFALNTINNRINTCSVRDMIKFINEMCPKFCPSFNYVLVEAKLNIIWRMSRTINNEKYTNDEKKYRDQYRDEILQIIEKLGAGNCTLRKLIMEEIH